MPDTCFFISNVQCPDLTPCTDLMLEKLGQEDYGQKYVYADYYELFDDEFKESRKKIKK